MVGSSGKTSMPAPPRWPEVSAATSASVSITSPRAALITRAPGFIAAKAAASTKPLVSFEEARCSEMKSLTA
ncbi:hypothetical protein D3C83_188010 [compost metagenome]